MANVIKSILDTVWNAVQITTPVESGPKPNVSMSELFVKVSHDLDGEDCEYDCTGCVVKYPRNFKIDEEENIYGNIIEWSTHLIVATGKSDWVRDVADEEGSLMEAINKFADVKPSNGRLYLSASNIPTQVHPASYAEPTSVLLLPAWLIIENVTPKSVNLLISEFVNKGPTVSTRATELSGVDHLQVKLPRSVGEMTSKPCPHNAIILLCSQGTRDARCGQTAPLLKKEFERHLREYGLVRDLDDETPGGVGLYFINHVGGHKFAANVIIYRKANAFGLDDPTEGSDQGPPNLVQVPLPEKSRPGEAAQCIWLARVKPEDCQGIIRYTVLKGKVVKPESQLRGGFDRCRGLASW